MMQRHNGWRFWGWTSTVMLGLWACAFADMTFNTFSSQLIFKTNASQLLLGKAQNVSGWSDLSITKDFGRNTPASWVEGFASGAIISQSGGTAVPQIHLITANSNAVKLMGTSSPSPVTQNSIDGTTYVQYEPNHHVFHTGAWMVRGWVRFNNGFTVMPRASVIMDTLTTVSGGFDLRETGTLILNNDLYLSHNVTLTSGGKIKGRSSSSGQANTIFMGGDLTLAATTFARVLHIWGDWSNSGTSGDLIIDGCGHTLDIQDRAQIFVDTNMTLTLRNMTVRTGKKSINKPAILLASLGSKLALDNVVFDLGTDFQFSRGQLFVHNEVAVTGTSAFVYTSPQASYITSGATWSFEQGTTFSVAPASYTALPYTGGTTKNNDFIVLADASSTLCLNGCSFKTTSTGLRLSRGMVVLDNSIAVDTMAGVDLDSTTPFSLLGQVSAGAGAAWLTWSPDGRYLATPDSSTPAGALRIYAFNGSGDPSLVGSYPLNNPASVEWSQDSQFLAVVTSVYSSQTLYIFRFTGNSSPTLVGTAPIAALNPIGVTWSPDGKNIVVTNDNSPGSIQVYSFDGVNVQSLGTVAAGDRSWRADWSPDGRFIAAVSIMDSSIRLYRFNGSGLPVSIGTVPTGSSPYQARWSPDGRYLLEVSPADFYRVEIYRFNGVGVPVSIGSVQTHAINRMEWSPNGRYMIGVVNGYQQLWLYAFNSTWPTTRIVAITGLPGYPNYIRWSPDGRTLAVTMGTSLYVYRCNFAKTPITQQVVTSSLLFGDRAKGATYDADVRLLGGAAVTVNGMVSDDSA